MSTAAKKTAAYGSWKSPITSSMLTTGNCKSICELQASDDTVYWIEQRFPTGCRTLFSKRADSEDIVQWTKEGFQVKNGVHEYGGGSFAVGAEGVFITNKGTVSSIITAEAEPTDLFAKEADLDIRHADLHVSPKGDIFAVEERHLGAGEPQNLLVRIDQNGHKTEITSGADFYAEPRVSPSGKHLVWMQWNHPNMPWDKTSIYIQSVEGSGKTEELLGGIGKAEELLGGGANYHGLQWGPQDELFVVCDKTNFWNVYEVDVEKKALKDNVYPVDSEIGNPVWQFADDRAFAVNAKHMVLAVKEELIVVERATKAKKPVQCDGFTHFSHLTVTSSGHFYCIASGPKKAQSLIHVDLNQEWKVSVIRETRDSADIEKLPISEPQNLEFQSDGVAVSGWFYEPKSNDFQGPEGALPPVVLMGHGGPSGQTFNSLDLKKQYFTSRGFAVFDVNYRGSTGFGTEFRNALYKNWGVVDRNDMINGANFLAENGKVDPAKICITGSSAGGYLVLSALIQEGNPFAAAVCVYGVSDLVGLYKDSHKFESGYNDSLIGKYPEEAEVYEQRSPINHIGKVKNPVAFIHGTKDPVVPWKQSESFYEALKKKGITTALMLLEGESHGFRSAEAISKSTDAGYVFLAKALGITPSEESDIDIVNCQPMKSSL
uniref:Peptidase_S9 domain-containing protein n=1 Tax=Steinernema glaseri TaxID=37863 RepID=A0A1I7ZS66_9BILA